MDAKTEIAQRLTSLRDQAHSPSYGAMYRYMVGRLEADGTPTDETIRRWHEKGVDPRQVSVEQLRILCEFYSRELHRPITLDDIDPVLASRWGNVKVIATTSRYARQPGPGQQALFDAAA